MASATLIKTSYREAVREAMRDAMRRDDRVFLMGEDVGHYGGCIAVDKLKPIQLDIGLV